MKPEGAVELGVSLWSQSTDWPAFQRAAVRVDQLGYSHLWTWDHLMPIFGELHQPVFEGWTTLGALAVATEQVDIGLLVGANTFRNPSIVAKAAVTLDHISNGRGVLGLGGAWFEPEHDAYGVDFGTGVGQRLERLEEAAGLVRSLLDGEEVTHLGPTYRTRGLRLSLPPIRAHIPMAIGGVGERRTPRTVARHAAMVCCQVGR